jgi:hypothetical protein
LAVLGPASEGADPGTIETRLAAVAPTLANYTRHLLHAVVAAGPMTQFDPRRETAETLASQVWNRLGARETPTLVDRLCALMTAPWIVHWAPLPHSPAAARRGGRPERFVTA